MRDIENREDIVKLVDQFYTKIMKDDLLSPFFKNLNLEIHLQKMVNFWAFVLLDEAGYTTNVTDKHINMPLNKYHFEQWIFLFNLTLDEYFEGGNVSIVKQRAALIGWTIESKLKNI